jgi:hypothetical protein
MKLIALVSVLPASLNIEKLDLLQNKLFWLKAKLILKGLKIQKTYLQKYHLFYREKGSEHVKMMENFIERNTV